MNSKPKADMSLGERRRGKGERKEGRMDRRREERKEEGKKGVREEEEEKCMAYVGNYRIQRDRG